MRIGHGYDVHKFGSKKPLKLGGVLVEHDCGLIAHSDGDVVLHAICDAVLGACALGDIGTHFPDTDPLYSGADSSKLLKHCIELAKERGLKLTNLDTTIVAQSPKVSPYILSMRSHLAELFETNIENINIKATTTEKLGFVGRKEGIATHAVCLLGKMQ